MKEITVTAHQRNLRALPCMVSDTDQQIELHHCHGGSMKEIRLLRGISVKTNPFLQIPLNHRYHTGQFNPEAMGMVTWEKRFGTQMSHLGRLEDLLGYNPFVQAGYWAAENYKSTGEF